MQNNAELQQKLQLLGKQVAAAAAANQGSGKDLWRIKYESFRWVIKMLFSAHQGITNQQLKQLSQKHQLVSTIWFLWLGFACRKCVGWQKIQQQMRNQSSPYARPNLIHAKPAITQKYEDLVGVIEELGKDVRPTYAGSKR